MPVNDLDGADKSAKLAVINVSPGQKFLAKWAREINARPDNRVKSGNLIEPRRRSPFFSSKVARSIKYEDGPFRRVVCALSSCPFSSFAE